MNTAEWRSVSTFAKFYDLPVLTANSFAAAVLGDKKLQSRITSFCEPVHVQTMPMYRLLIVNIYHIAISVVAAVLTTFL